VDPLANLNPRQKEAVAHVEGPLLVLAGAGSGKTRVLAHRIAYLLAEAGAHPHEILAVTFTNKAAGEMKERVRGLVGPVSVGLWMGTFHSICARILRIEGRRLGISSDFTIYDEQDQLALVKRAMADLGLSQTKTTPATVLSRISWAKSNLLSPDDLLDQGGHYDRRTAEVYAAYESGLRVSNALDFDDLICTPVKIFRQSAEALERASGRFRYVLIDEYQDTNRAQYELVRLLSERHRNICVVGDDDQSIYRWRGADVSNILNFEQDFPDAMVVRLEQSYRSTKTILAASQAVIACNRRRKAKELWTENDVGKKIGVAFVGGEQDEGRLVADMVESLAREEERRYCDFVVLYRTNAQSRSIEDALRRKGMPYVIVGGTKFYERKEIKDVVAYLRLLVNPQDSVSLLRVINVPPRGIGDVTITRLKEFAVQRSCSLSEALDGVSEIDRIHSGTRQKLEVFASLMADLRAAAKEKSLGDLIGFAAERSGYLEHLKQQATVEALTRTENIRELVASGFEFEESREGATLGTFLEEIALVMDIDLWDDRKDAVSLMTLHNAKGLEFPVVFIAGVEEGLLPHHTSFEDDEEIEEERRLFYVGLTRARQRVIVSLASGRRGFQGWVPQVASRFLEEIPQEYIELLTTEYVSYGRGDSDWVPDEEKVVRVGTRVRHPDWGIGRVVRCEGFGDSLRLVVTFGPGLTKRLMARYANLELLEESEL
jgi:DNA helicase-2/ATP-dependent DNA helicase PcrA